VAGARRAGPRPLILTIGGVAPAWVYATTRRASLWLIVAAFAAAHLAFDWRARDFDATLYPLARRGRLFCPLLTRRRNYDSSERGWTVTILSSGDRWRIAPPPASSSHPCRLTRRRAVAGRDPRVGGADDRAGRRRAGGDAGGLRLRLKLLAAFGTSALMLAFLLGIAIAQPENVQAYTLPAGLYLLALGFAWRRSPALIEPHLDANEGLQLAGMLAIVLPAAEQAWEPGGGRFGLELIGVGLVLLAAGVTVSARWLVVGGVLTLTGVALAGC
jgi:hypothetical protein